MRTCRHTWLLALVSAGFGIAADWPQWRGPGRDGHIPALAGDMPSGLERVWDVAVGEGYSSLVSAGGLLYVHARRGADEVVTALSAETGAVAWEQSYEAAFSKNPYATEVHAGPFATPLLYAGRLYTLGGKAVLSCWDPANGELIWRRDDSERVDTSKMFTGTAASPLGNDGNVIVYVGDDTGGSILALNSATGAMAWRWDGDGPGYAAPRVRNVGGRQHLLTMSDGAMLALDPTDGRMLWKHPFPDEWHENIMTPAVYEDTVVVSGVRNGTVGLRVAETDGAWTAKSLWVNDQIRVYMSLPVQDGPWLMGLSKRDKGRWFRLDMRTGDVAWSSEPRQTEQASVFLSGGRLLAFTVEGHVRVMEAGVAEYREVGRFELEDAGAIWAQPVIDGGDLYVRHGERVSRYRWSHQ